MKVPGRQRQVQQTGVLRPVRPRQADVSGGAARPRRALHLLRQPRAEAEVRGRARPQARPGPVHGRLHEISERLYHSRLKTMTNLAIHHFSIYCHKLPSLIYYTSIHHIIGGWHVSMFS